MTRTNPVDWVLTVHRTRRPTASAWLSLLLGLWCLVAGCGDAVEYPGLMRLELRNEQPDVDPPQPEVVARFDLVTEQADWSIEAPVYGVILPEEADMGTGPEMLFLASGVAEKTVRVARSGLYDPASFNRISVTLTMDGDASLGVEFFRDGGFVYGTDTVRIPIQRQVTLVVFDLPFDLREVEPFDVIAVRCWGQSRKLGLRNVELLDMPVASLVPDPDEPPALVLVDSDARRGVGISADRPVVTSVDIRFGGQLSFSYGVPQAARRSLEDPELIVTLASTSGRRSETRYVCTGRWQDVSIPLAQYIGERLDLRFALGPDEGSACVVTEPMVWAPVDEPRTVLLVTSDTHRGDHLGVAPFGVDVTTPSIDALAERGLYFSDCFAPANSTNPSHVALMTGRSPRDTGVLTNYQPLSSAAHTLAELFRQEGFVTMAAVSAAQLGDPGSGLGQGFDRMTWPTGWGTRPSTETISLLADWLPAAEGRPLFLWLHVFDAHTPYEPPLEFVADYYDVERDVRDSQSPLPEVINAPTPHEASEMGDLHWPLAMYKGEISHLDAQLSQVFALDRVASGLIALVGDHGESLGEREIYFNHRSLYVTLHVPLLLAGAGVPVGLQSDRPVTHLDLGRTLLDLSSMEDASFPGRNLIRQATDPTDHDRPRYAVEGYGESASVTVAGLHLILNLKEKDDRFTGEARERHEVELYDLDRDRRCDVNLVQTRVEDARRLRRLLVAWLLDAVEEDWAHERVTDRAAIEALQEMGYLESSLARSEAFWVPDDCRWCERFGDRP